MQSLGLSGVISLGAQHAIGRGRPYTEECPPGYVGPTKTGFNTCGGASDNQSFYSGHAAASFTMAGLTCIHHQKLPLYGGGWPEAVPCIVMLTAASGTSVLRMFADRHWATDIVLGAGVGIFNGYFIPALLHYGFGSYKAPQVKTAIHTSIGTIAPIPQVYQGGGGLAVAIF
jgi:membrane-associated phospholipid phosphatase